MRERLLSRIRVNSEMLQIPAVQQHNRNTSRMAKLRETEEFVSILKTSYRLKGLLRYGPYSSIGLRYLQSNQINGTLPAWSSLITLKDL